jgi:uncharacterized protein YhhL (DUF1145 family)
VIKPVSALITIVMWLAVIINLFTPLLAENSHWLNWLGAFLVIAHLAECIIFRKNIVASYPKPLIGFVIVFIFGLARTQEWIGKKPAAQ